MKINVTSTLEMNSLSQMLSDRGLNEKGRVQRYIDSEAIRLMSDYTPFDQGSLINSATRLTEIGSGQIEQGGSSVSYARRWYYTEAKFQDASRRGTHWFERMAKNGGSKHILDGAKREAGIE